jgi:CRP-like cAMP-binding protein
MAHSSQILNFKAGDILIRENELSRKMYVIRKGKVRVFKNYMGQKITLGMFGDGEVFGELSFVDAQPRSASVEAITDVETYVIDGADAEKQLNDLPEWILGVLKTVFHRFRELDAKLVVYQSMSEVERRHFRTDKIAMIIYQELLRFNRVLEMTQKGLHDKAIPLRENTFFTDYKDLLGECRISLELYWKLLKRFDFIDESHLNREGTLKFNMNLLSEFQAYLDREHRGATYRVMSHSGLGLLRKIVTWAKATPNPTTGQTIDVPFAEQRLDSMPFFDEARQDLQAHALVLYSDQKTLQLSAEAAFKTFLFQSMIKAFDSLTMAMD